jgi:hypothetical protein
MTDANDDLDALFSQAAKQVIAPSDDLMQRIFSDAAALQPSLSNLTPAASAPMTAASRGWFVALSDWFGGTGALAGMSAAAIAGLYIGAVQPTMVSDLTAYVSGETVIDSLDLLPATGTLWAEN